MTPAPPDRSTAELSLEWLAVVLAASLPLYRPWVSLSAHLILLLWFIAPGLRGRLQLLRQHRLSLAVLAFIALNLLSLAWSAEPGAGFDYALKYRYLLLIPMIATVVPDDRVGVVAGTFIVSAAASVGLSAAVATGLLRFGGAFPGNPSPTMAHLDYSLVLAVASLLALVRVLYGDGGPRGRLAWAAAFMVLAAGLAINIGRGGQVGFVVGLFVLLPHWSRGRTRTQIAGAFAVLLLAVLVLATAAPPAVQRIAAGLEELRAAVVEQSWESNVGGRVAALRVAGEIVASDPILGTGVGANMAAFRHRLDTELGELKPAIYWYRHFHNQYTQLATELGIAGLAALGLVFWLLARGPYRSRAISAAALVTAVTYLVAFVSEPFLQKQIPLVTLALLGGLFAAHQLAEPASGQSEGSRSGPCGPAAGISPGSRPR
ncbi:MAG: O-antigen ligase family protein [Thermoanaerobaculales bacterium]|jgi:O-antigen ligase|nr:O-antigen ligase family protein [Thermoanaerobaculales bacterium]